MKRRNDPRSRRNTHGNSPQTDQRGGRRGRRDERSSSPPKKLQPGKLRIIGGHHRGRTIRYHGAAFTRPMKDSVRENLFNILGPAVKGSICFDLFAGTGALALESISRGAVLSFAVEQSRLAVRVLRETSEEIGVADQLRVLHGDTFRLADRLLSGPVDGFDEQAPWIVYLCPPYRMWEDELDRSRLNGLIESTRRNGPPGSLVVAETERRFDPDLLPTAEWDLREYGDTRLAILEIEP